MKESSQQSSAFIQAMAEPGNSYLPMQQKNLQESALISEGRVEKMQAYLVRNISEQAIAVAF